jgi:hypothetical protein
LNILSLENGEWGENMSEDAFGKFRKKRAGLQNLFSNDDSDPPSPTTTTTHASTSTMSTSSSSSTKHHHEHHKPEQNKLLDGHHKTKDSKKTHHKTHAPAKSPKTETSGRGDKEPVEDKLTGAASDPSLRSWAKFRQQKEEEKK